MGLSATSASSCVTRLLQSALPSWLTQKGISLYNLKVPCPLGFTYSEYPTQKARDLGLPLKACSRVPIKNYQSALSSQMFRNFQNIIEHSIITHIHEYTLINTHVDDDLL